MKNFTLLTQCSTFWQTLHQPRNAPNNNNSWQVSNSYMFRKKGDIFSATHSTRYCIALTGM